MSLWKWSQTAANNSNADPTINWAEGMAPSAVNDSSRSLMAAVAKYRDDMSGSLLCNGGSTTAYSVTTNQGFDTLAHLDGKRIVFTPNFTNGLASQITLSVDSLAFMPIRLSPGVDIPDAGVLVQGAPYAVTYNNADGAFYLNDQVHSLYVVPIGGLLPYSATTLPNSAFIIPTGQAISRGAFNTLFNLYNSIGLPYGSGNGSTTFNIPNLTGVGITSVSPAVFIPYILRIL